MENAMNGSGLYRLGPLVPSFHRDGRFYLAPGAIVIGDVPAQVVRALDAVLAGKLAQAAARYRAKSKTYPQELRAVGPARGGS